MTPDPIFDRHPDGITLNIPLSEGGWVVLSLLGIGILFIALLGLIRALQSPPKWPRLPPLPIPSWIVWPLILLVFVLAIPAIWQFFKAVTGLDIFADNAEQHAAIRNSGLVVAALIGVPFLVWRSVVAQKQVNVAEQSHITDQINKAVENIGATRSVSRQRCNQSGTLLYEHGSDDKPDYKKPIFENITEPNIEVRIGGILSLERIAHQSIRDHVRIMEILTSYIRSNAPLSPSSPQNDSAHRTSTTPTVPTPDIQIAISVIGRRSEAQKKAERSHLPPLLLDLSFSNLRGIDFSLGDFSETSFTASNLDDALFLKTNLKNSIFSAASMIGSVGTLGNVDGARLNSANSIRQRIERYYGESEHSDIETMYQQWMDRLKSQQLLQHTEESSIRPSKDSS